MSRLLAEGWEPLGFSGSPTAAIRSFRRKLQPPQDGWATPTPTPAPTPIPTPAGHCHSVAGASCLNWSRYGYCLHVPRADWLRREPRAGEWTNLDQAEPVLEKRLQEATRRSSMRGRAMVFAAVALTDHADQDLSGLPRFLEAALTSDEPEALWDECGLPPWDALRWGEFATGTVKASPATRGDTPSTADFVQPGSVYPCRCCGGGSLYRCAECKSPTASASIPGCSCRCPEGKEGPRERIKLHVMTAKGLGCGRSSGPSVPWVELDKREESNCPGCLAATDPKPAEAQELAGLEWMATIDGLPPVGRWVKVHTRDGARDAQRRDGPGPKRFWFSTDGYHPKAWARSWAFPR